MCHGLSEQLTQGEERGPAHSEHKGKASSCQSGQPISFHALNSHLNNQSTERRNEWADISDL